MQKSKSLVQHLETKQEEREDNESLWPIEFAGMTAQFDYFGDNINEDKPEFKDADWKDMFKKESDPEK